jgi:hypothetical protein
MVRHELREHLVETHARVLRRDHQHIDGGIGDGRER